MTTALDVIAKAMGDPWYDDDACHCSRCAAEHQEELDKVEGAISALRSAGYVIIKDRTDPEGGIPGRKT